MDPRDAALDGTAPRPLSGRPCSSLTPIGPARTLAAVSPPMPGGTEATMSFQPHDRGPRVPRGGLGREALRPVTAPGATPPSRAAAWAFSVLLLVACPMEVSGCSSDAGAGPTAAASSRAGGTGSTSGPAGERGAEGERGAGGERVSTDTILGGADASGTNPEEEPATDPEPELSCPLSFEEHIVPIIDTYGCLQCHSKASPSGGLSLDSLEDLLAGGATGGPGAIECDPGASTILLKVSLDPPFGARMPLVGEKLLEEEIDLIEAWIAQGLDACGCVPPEPEPEPTIEPEDEPDAEPGVGPDSEPELEPDSGPDPEPETGALGWPCEVDEECSSGYCLEGSDGLYCSELCVEVCPSGYVCAPVSVPDIEVIYLCVEDTSP